MQGMSHAQGTVDWHMGTTLYTGYMRSNNSFLSSRRSYCSKLREWGWRRKKKGKLSDSSTRIAPTAGSASAVLGLGPFSKYSGTTRTIY